MFTSFCQKTKTLLCLKCLKDVSEEDKQKCFDIETSVIDVSHRFESALSKIEAAVTVIKEAIDAFSLEIKELQNSMEIQHTGISTVYSILTNIISKSHEQLLKQLNSQFENQDRTFQQQLMVLLNLLPILENHLHIAQAFKDNSNKYEFLSLAGSFIDRLSSLSHLNKYQLRPNQINKIQTNYKSVYIKGLEPIIANLSGTNNFEFPRNKSTNNKSSKSRDNTRYRNDERVINATIESGNSDNIGRYSDQDPIMSTTSGNFISQKFAKRQDINDNYLLRTNNDEDNKRFSRFDKQLLMLHNRFNLVRATIGELYDIFSDPSNAKNDSTYQKIETMIEECIQLKSELEKAECLMNENKIHFAQQWEEIKCKISNDQSLLKDQASELKMFRHDLRQVVTLTHHFGPYIKAVSAEQTKQFNLTMTSLPNITSSTVEVHPSKDVNIENQNAIKDKNTQTNGRITRMENNDDNAITTANYGDDESEIFYGGRESLEAENCVCCPEHCVNTGPSNVSVIVTADDTDENLNNDQKFQTMRKIEQKRNQHHFSRDYLDAFQPLSMSSSYADTSSSMVSYSNIQPDKQKVYHIEPEIDYTTISNSTLFNNFLHKKNFSPDSSIQLDRNQNLQQNHVLFQDGKYNDKEEYAYSKAKSKIHIEQALSQVELSFAQGNSGPEDSQESKKKPFSSSILNALLEKVMCSSTLLSLSNKRLRRHTFSDGDLLRKKQIQQNSSKCNNECYSYPGLQETANMEMYSKKIMDLLHTIRLNQMKRCNKSGFNCKNNSKYLCTACEEWKKLKSTTAEGLLLLAYFEEQKASPHFLTQFLKDLAKNIQEIKYFNEESIENITNRQNFLQSRMRRRYSTSGLDELTSVKNKCCMNPYDTPHSRDDDDVVNLKTYTPSYASKSLDRPPRTHDNSMYCYSLSKDNQSQDQFWTPSIIHKQNHPEYRTLIKMHPKSLKLEKANEGCDSDELERQLQNMLEIKSGYQYTKNETKRFSDVQSMTTSQAYENADGASGIERKHHSSLDGGVVSSYSPSTSASSASKGTSSESNNTSRSGGHIQLKKTDSFEGHEEAVRTLVEAVQGSRNINISKESK